MAEMFGLKRPLPITRQVKRDVDRGHRADRQEEMAGHEKEAADHDRLAITELAIRQPAADERTGVNEHQIIRVERRRVVARPGEALARGVAQIEREHREHRVVAEALPHLGREKDVEPLRMFLVRCCHRRGVRCHGGHTFKSEDALASSLSLRKKCGLGLWPRAAGRHLFSFWESAGGAKEFSPE